MQPTGSKHGRHSPEPVSSPAPSLIISYDSGLEADRATYLEGLVLARLLLGYAYHPFKVKLDDDTYYEPDFLIWYADGTMELEEVKGDKRMKNVRESLIRLKWAAQRLWMFDWYLTVRPKREWRRVRV